MVNNWKYITKIQRLCLSVPLLFFCLFTQSASALNVKSHVDIEDSGEYISSGSNHSMIHLENYNADFFNHPFQLPSEPIPALNEPEDNKENEDDEESSELHFRSYVDFDSAFKSTDFTFAQFEQNVLKRPKISLVTLYHSWKSFLS